MLDLVLALIVAVMLVAGGMFTFLAALGKSLLIRRGLEDGAGVHCRLGPHR